MRLSTTAILLFLIPFHCAARSLEDPIQHINGVGVEILKFKDEPKTLGDPSVNGARDEGSLDLGTQPPVNGAGDEGSPNLGTQPPVNGAGDEGSPKLDTQPPLNGAGDEGSPHLKAEKRLQVNGQGIAPEMKYDSGENSDDVDTSMFHEFWFKNSEKTQWCTTSGRSKISVDKNNPITAAQCQASCMERNPECYAVEFWEKYNYACYECTDPSLITEYTITGDWGYPVYVWVRGFWFKNSENTQWCTNSGRSKISADKNNPITAAQCQASCMERNPECQAVEFWETYNYACFECTNPSLITEYTNTNDLAYPVYVWIPGFWFKNSEKTQWCTTSGRSKISVDKNNPITAAQCQASCMKRNPECQAVEFWETYNYACYECTDPSLITEYTITGDWGYPVYVWVRGG